MSSGIVRTIVSLFVTILMLVGQESMGNEVEDGYFAVLHGGVGEQTYQTYVYETDSGYNYVNTVSTTVSWGSPQWNREVRKRGRASTKAEIVEIAKKNGSCDYVMFTGENKARSINAFLEDIPEFSSKYLIGFTYGGGGTGEGYDDTYAEVVICTDRTLLVYMPVEAEGFQKKDLVATLTLPEIQYEKIEAAIDKVTLFTLSPECDENMCDGNEYYLDLFDENDELVKRCGGYEPQSREFWKAYSTVMLYLPMKELQEIRANYRN